jgi:hypothetical protein
MTKLRLAATLLALTAAAAGTPALAAEEGPKFGLGIAILPLTGAPTVEVYVPIALAPTWRIEPSLGIRTDDQPAGGVDTRDITLGVGFFYIKKLAPPLDLQLGGRLKLNFAHTSGVTSQSGTDVILAGAVGGEYYLIPKFSLGLEGNLGYYSNSAASGDNAGWFTAGLAFLRFYF